MMSSSLLFFSIGAAILYRKMNMKYLCFYSGILRKNLSNCLDYQPIEVKSADLSKPWFRLPAGLILVCCCTDYYYAPLCVCWLYKLMYNGDRISVFLCFKASLTISLLAGCCWIWVSYSLGPPGGIFDIETKWQKIYLS